MERKEGVGFSVGVGNLKCREGEAKAKKYKLIVESI